LYNQSSLNQFVAEVKIALLSVEGQHQGRQGRFILGISRFNYSVFFFKRIEAARTKSAIA